MIDAAETHPQIKLTNLLLLERPKFGRYETKFYCSSIDVVRDLAEKQYLTISSASKDVLSIRGVAGALRKGYSVVAGSSLTIELPHDALLMVETWDEISGHAALVPVRELQNCQWLYDHGVVHVEERPDNHWYFSVVERGAGPVPNPDSEAFSVSIYVFQENGEARYRDQIHAVARSAAQHVRIMLPQTNVLAFDQEHMADVFTQMDKLVVLHRNGQHIAAEQLVRQTILACATRHAAC